MIGYSDYLGFGLEALNLKTALLQRMHLEGVVLCGFTGIEILSSI